MAQDVARPTPEQVTAIVDQLEAMFASQNVDLYVGATWLKQRLDENYPLLVATQSRVTLEAFFSNVPMGEAEEATLMMQLLAVFPKLIPTWMEKSVVAAAETITPPKGPPSKTSPELRRTVVAEIAKLHRKGAPIGVAQSRIASRHQLSKRTVQRIWQERKNLAEEPFLTTEEVWKFLAE